MNRRRGNTEIPLFLRLTATRMTIKVLRDAVIYGNITYQLGKSSTDADVADKERGSGTKTTVEEGDVFALSVSLRFYITST